MLRKLDFRRSRQLGQAMSSGMPLGARERFLMGRYLADRLSMLWAEDEPQQFQSSSSISSISMLSQNLSRDKVFSWPEAFKEQPGKNEKFNLSAGSPESGVLEDLVNGFFILNLGRG